MQPSGTPAITLPNYVAPVFTTPSAPLGQVITNLKIVSTSSTDQINSPFTCGHIFKVGQVAPSDSLVGLQMDVKATHKDGSVRHAILSGIVAKLGAGAIVEIPLIRCARVEGAAPTPVVPVSVVITAAGVKYTAKEVGNIYETHVNGPLAVDRITANAPFVNDAGVAHPDITAQFSHRAYTGTTNERIDVTVEHTKAYTATTDIVYDVQVIVAGEVRYSKTGLVHFPCARWRKVYWSGITPAIHIKHDTKYLLESKALPNWEQINIAESSLINYGQMLTTSSFEPMTYGRWQPAMATTGGRPDIGLAPDIYVAAVLSMDKRAKDCMLVQADMAGSWLAHRRDPTGRLLDVVHYSRATIAGTWLDAKNPLTGLSENLPPLVASNKSQHDSAHQPAFAYIPYLLTGDYFYLEELQFWCNYNSYVSNPGYRGYEKGLVYSDQVRGQGWSIRTMAEAEYITPDKHPSKSIFAHLLNSNMEYYRANFTDATNNVLGVVTCGSCIEYPVKGAPQSGLAPWMDDFFTQAVGHAAELGSAEAGRLLKWKAKFQVGRMDVKGFSYFYATTYALRVRDARLAPFYTTLEQCFTNTVDPLEPALTEMLGYPYSTEGFPSNYQPALAMCVDSGYAGGQEAWATFASRKVKPDYSVSPQFNVVPRTVGMVAPPITVVLPPVVNPPPVTVPPVVAPPVVIVPKINVVNPEFINQSGLAVIVTSGLKTKPFVNLVGDNTGAVTIIDPWLVLGVKYTCTVIDSTGYTIATIFPIKAI